MNLSIRLLVFVIALVLNSQSSAVIVIAEWDEFNGDFPATTGAGDINVSTNGSVNSGNTLEIEANSNFFNNPGNTFWDIFIAGMQTEDITLMYEVLRTDGGNNKTAPNQIDWAYSVDGGTNFVPVSSSSIGAGANTDSVDFSGIAAFDTAAQIQFRATFSGATGGNGSSLAFDNVRVTAVPEPTAFVMLGLLSSVAFGWHRFGRGRDSDH